MKPMLSLNERLRARRAAQRNGEAAMRPGARGITADELLRMEFPEPKYVIPGVVVEGLTAFAGRPKIGKSWEVVGDAVAVASGGRALGQIQVEQGEVLLLALEDTPRRLQHRLRTILAGEPAPKALTVFTEWPRLHEGGLDKLHDWLTKHPDCRLVDIDTLAKVLPPRKRNADAYEADYDIGGKLQRLAAEHRVGLRFTCHTRKASGLDGDWLDEVLGSTGITGVTDSVLVLKRARGQFDATLHVTGRDLEEQALALRFDSQTGLWALLGNAADQPRSKERAEVLEVLRLAQAGMGPAAVAKTLAKDRNATKWLMYQMWQDGELVNKDGTYYLRPRGIE